MQLSWEKMEWLLLKFTKNSFLKIIFKDSPLRIILVMYPERMIIGKDTCSRTFITALLTVAKMRATEMSIDR